jgi:hypothetical protein
MSNCVDWGEARSACEARDWRRAWQAVGTDNTGDATPGETYLLNKAARARATAAALYHWREIREREVPLARGNVSWLRIKRIAGWSSQARAQYAKRSQYVAWDVGPGGDRTVVQHFRLTINGEVQTVAALSDWHEPEVRVARDKKSVATLMAAATEEARVAFPELIEFNRRVKAMERTFYLVQQRARRGR